MVKILQVLGWLELFGGIVGSVWIWVVFGTKLDMYRVAREVNPVGLAIGMAVLLQGALGCVLSLVVASMAESMSSTAKDVSKVREHLTSLK